MGCNPPINVSSSPQSKSGLLGLISLIVGQDAQVVGTTTTGRLGVGVTTPNNLFQAFDLIDFNNFNTKLGYQAGKNIGTVAKGDTFVGYQSGFSSAAGLTDSDNTAIGYRSLYSNTTGSENIANGNNALYSNTTGNLNTASGNFALHLNTTGSFNSAHGADALMRNTIGRWNTANGDNALVNNTTGNYNTGVGDMALYGNTTGNYNTGVGVNSLQANKTGSNNVALGYLAGGYELGSNAFYVDNRDRLSTTGDKAGALLYGTFDTTSANQKLTINANVGIGATNPQRALVVGGGVTPQSLGANLIVTGGPIYAGHQGVSIELYDGMVPILTSPETLKTVSSAGIGYTTGSNNDWGGLSFWVNLQDMNSKEAAMKIFKNGNVGIGVISPNSASQKLEVVGNIKASGYYASDNSAGLTKDITVKGSVGLNCVLTVRNGLITATTCP